MNSESPHVRDPTIFQSTILSAFTTVVLLGLVASAFVPGLRLPVIVLQVGFVLLHGARRYGWRAIGVFVAAGLVISNILENLSIQTSFPFGRYHYTGDGKIFQVPWFIGPAYLATGYLAWVVAAVLLDDLRRDSPWLSTIGTPVIGAFAMTAWDLALDPATSTINQACAEAGDLQAVLLYAATTLSFITKFLTGERTTVTDAAGAIWRTSDIYETSTLLAVYGMSFLALLALLRIAQRGGDTRTVHIGHNDSRERSIPKAKGC
jgi:putative membrane protein